MVLSKARSQSGFLNKNRLYIMSRAEHVIFCLNKGGPSSKPKNF